MSVILCTAMYCLQAPEIELQRYVRAMPLDCLHHLAKGCLLDDAAAGRPMEVLCVVCEHLQFGVTLCAADSKDIFHKSLPAS